MIQSKIFIESNPSTLEEELNDFLKKLTQDQIINIYYTSNATDSYRRYSIIVLYHTESITPNTENEKFN